MRKTIMSLLLALPMSFLSISGMAQGSELNYDNKTDFVNAKKGFIATWEEPEIKNEDGSVAYSLAKWDFLDKECPSTANKSLWRQSQLNKIHGLFEVIPNKVYQIRGFDLANMTFVKSDNGWIIIDVTTSKAAAAAGYELVKKHLGDYPIEAIIITHPHIDHFGGIDGITENAPNDDYEIIAPKDFLKFAQEENIMAGVTMTRRASYMYGFLLEKNEVGNIGSGLGQTNAIGSNNICKPTIEIGETGKKLNIDGVDMEFIFAPSAEAPVEIMVYFPQMKAFCTAEEITHTLHNLLTLRGALVRNGLLWSKHIDKTLELYGDEVEISFSSHHWPTWGNKEIVSEWTSQRDIYRYIHDQTLHLANKGYTPKEIAEEIVLPESLDTLFNCRGYYGTISHNVKAQYQMYFGWFDGNPANLNPLPPVEESKKYVEAIGGERKVMKVARKAFKKGEYRWCATLLNNLVFAEPKHKAARKLLSDTYKQLGYQAESGPWRNFYLTGAQEVLKYDVAKLEMTTSNINTVIALNNDKLLDFMAIQINGKFADGKEAAVNIHFTDTKEDLSMTLGNGTLNHRLNSHNNNADLLITLSKKDFVKVMLHIISPDALISSGKMQIKGNLDSLNTILGSMDKPVPNFNIVTP